MPDKRQPWEARMDAIDKRLDRIAALHEKSDKRIDSILKLMQTGARHLVRMEEAQRKFFESLNRPNGGHKR